MGPRGTPRFHPPRRDGGYVLVIALLIVGILFVAASSFMRLTLSEDLIAASDRDLTLALNAAEAGVQQGIQNIRGAGVALSALLGNPSQTSGSLTFSNGGSYTFRIENDPAESATPTVDSNGFLKITSTGRVRNAIRIIETVLYLPTGPPFPSAIHMTGNEADARFEGTLFRVDGRDTDPTSETPTGIPINNKVAVSVDRTSDPLLDQMLRNQIHGALTPLQRDTSVLTSDASNPGDYGGRPSLGVVATSLNSNTIQQSVTNWATFAPPANILNLPNSGQGNASFSGTRTYTNGCQGGPNATGARANHAWGCPTNPGVFYIKGITESQYNANNNIASGDVSMSGTFQGAGILMVDGADLSFFDNFRWEGIIILTGPLVGLKISGSAKIFGSVVVNERARDTCVRRSDCRELILEGTAAVRYSQTAINRAFGALPARYAYWNERSL